MVGFTSAVYINISAFLMMLGVGMGMALLPQLVINLSESVSDIGYLASAFALTFVAFQLPIGYFSDKLGIKPFLIAGYFITALSGMVYYYSNTLEIVLLGRMFQGLGEIPVWTLAPAFFSLQRPAAKGKAIAIYNAAIHCGLILGCLLGMLGQTICEGNQLFLIFSGLSLLSGVLVIGCVENIRPVPMPTPKLGSILSLGANLNTQVVFLGVVLYGAGYGVFISVIPGFLIQGPHAGMVGVVFILFYLAVSGVQMVAGPISDKKGRQLVMVMGLIGAGMGMLLFSFMDILGLLTMLFVAGAGLGTFCVAALAYLNDTVPGNLKGCISAAFYFFWGLGYFIGPILLGELGAAGFWHSGFVIFGCLMLAAGIACFMTVRGTYIHQRFFLWYISMWRLP